MSTESPCKKQCKLNPMRVCISCGRDIESIANWSRMTDKQKDQANKDATHRLARHQQSTLEAIAHEIR